MGRGHGKTASGGGGLSSLAKSLKAAEAQIRGDGMENAFVFDAKGNEVYRNDGTQNVSYNPILQQLMRRDSGVYVPDKLIPNNIVTHNHPNNDSFSSADIRKGIENNASELRVVGPTATYSLKRPSGGWGIRAGEFDKAYKAAFSQSQSQHETMQKVASQFGLKYEYEFRG